MARRCIDTAIKMNEAMGKNAKADPDARAKSETHSCADTKTQTPAHADSTSQNHSRSKTDAKAKNFSDAPQADRQGNAQAQPDFEGLTRGPFRNSKGRFDGQLLQRERESRHTRRN